MTEPELRPCSCGAPIAWARVRTKAGKWSPMPLDPEPNPAGNVAAYIDHRRVLIGRTLGKDGQAEPFEKRYVSHFATCPHDDRHRRRPNGVPGNVIALDEARRRRAARK